MNEREKKKEEDRRHFFSSWFWCLRGEKELLYIEDLWNCCSLVGMIRKTNGRRKQSKFEAEGTSEISR